MKTSSKIILIVFAVLAQFAWITYPRISRHGQVLDEPYRRSERFSTLVAKSQHPSPEAEAAFNREVDLLHAHIARREHATFALLLILNAGVIYWLWCYGNPKNEGQPAASPNGGPAERFGNSGAIGGPPSVS